MGIYTRDVLVFFKIVFDYTIKTLISGLEWSETWIGTTIHVQYNSRVDFSDRHWSFHVYQSFKEAFLGRNGYSGA